MPDQPPDDDLDFEQAQYTSQAPAGLVCTTCGQPPAGTYYSVNSATTCAACLQTARAGQRGSFIKALALGLLAGAVGALVYYGIRTITGYDLALITIALGVIVGIAVRMGAGDRRSMLYRLIALGITWVSMCIVHVPMVAESMLAPEVPVAAEEPGADEVGSEGVPPPTEELVGGEGEPVAPDGAVYAVAVALSMIIPFLMLKELEVLGVLIFAFGLWEAWKLSAPRPFEVAGPFELVQRQPEANERTAADAEAG